jgi:hypothetical protein
VCEALLDIAIEILDWRLPREEAFELHLKHCVEALALVESADPAAAAPAKLHQRSYGAFFEVRFADHDLVSYFSLAEPVLWTPFKRSLGKAGTLHLAFTDGEDGDEDETPYTENALYAGAVALCRPGAAKERQAVQDLRLWLDDWAMSL